MYYKICFLLKKVMKTAANNMALSNVKYKNNVFLLNSASIKYTPYH